MSVTPKTPLDEFKPAKADAATIKSNKQHAAFDFWARTIEAGQRTKVEQAFQQNPRLKV
jgi:hypothetical protein